LRIRFFLKSDFIKRSNKRFALSLWNNKKNGRLKPLYVLASRLSLVFSPFGVNRNSQIVWQHRRPQPPFFIIAVGMRFRQCKLMWQLKSLRANWRWGTNSTKFSFSVLPTEYQSHFIFINEWWNIYRPVMQRLSEFILPGSGVRTCDPLRAWLTCTPLSYTSSWSYTFF
jgi:hypothetical protein